MRCTPVARASSSAGEVDDREDDQDDDESSDTYVHAGSDSLTPVFETRDEVARVSERRSAAGRAFVLDLDIWIDRVRTLVEVFGIRAAGLGVEFLLFGRQLLTPGARRPLLGGCGLPVGLDSSDLGEVSGLGGLVAMVFRHRFSAAFRPDETEHSDHDDRDDDDDDNKSSHLRRVPAPRRFKPEDGPRALLGLAVSWTRRRTMAMVLPRLGGRHGHDGLRTDRAALQLPRSPTGRARVDRVGPADAGPARARAAHRHVPAALPADRVRVRCGEEVRRRPRRACSRPS